MVESEPGIMRLPAELHQRICDYITSDVGDQTMTVTLDQNDRLNFENGQTVLYLACTSKAFEDQVLSYLFQHITFVLTDSQRTCRDIVRAFFRALTSRNRARVRKIAIPFFTIHGLFDPAHFANPLFLQRYDPGLHFTISALREELAYALTLLNQLPALKHLKLGVDVIEWLAYSFIPNTQTSAQTPNIAATLDQVRQGRLSSNHALLHALRPVSGLLTRRHVQLEMDWGSFVSNTYTRAGLDFGPLWTMAVKKEMEAQFEKIVAAHISQ